MGHPPLCVLLELTQVAREEVPMGVVQEGEQAMDFLYSRAAFIGSQRPDLMLLDLTIPKIGGPEVLSEISKNPDLSEITIVIVTTFVRQPISTFETISALRFVSSNLWTTLNICGP
jgi:CheY-like chemotaxis protein